MTVYCPYSGRYEDVLEDYHEKERRCAFCMRSVDDHQLEADDLDEMEAQTPEAQNG